MNGLPIKLELPNDFLEEEIRCDYRITKDMKEVWAVELDLLNELLNVCKKYGIKVYADGGTLLGTIRHSGFIPWDDDIDVVMLRDEYDKLCCVAKKEFSGNYFFQTEYTDPTSMRGHAQLRNSKTTGILKSEDNGIRKFNQGIFIDIFPLDAVPGNKILLKQQIKKIKTYITKARKLLNIGAVYIPSSNKVKDIVKKIIYRLFSGTLGKFIDFQKYYIKYEAECKRYNNENTRYVAKLFAVPFKKKRVWFRDDFKETISFPFEFLKIPVPVGYDRILTSFFGNDWSIPKHVGSTHSGVIFDTRKSYKDYLGGRK